MLIHFLVTLVIVLVAMGFAFFAIDLGVSALTSSTAVPNPSRFSLGAVLKFAVAVIVFIALVDAVYGTHRFLVRWP